MCTCTEDAASTAVLVFGVLLKGPLTYKLQVRFSCQPALQQMDFPTPAKGLISPRSTGSQVQFYGLNSKVNAELLQDQ